jgi:hypothetical protein
MFAVTSPMRFLPWSDALRWPGLLLVSAAIHCGNPSPQEAPLGTPAQMGGLGGQGAEGGKGGSSEGGAAGQGGGAGALPGGGSGSGGDSGSAGEDGALEVIPAMFVAKDVNLDPIEEGEAIPLSLPPQGGHVLWIGAYLKNLKTDTVELRSRLRDPATGELVAEEGRTVAVRPVEGQPGLFQPDIRTVSQVTHVPVCPVYEPRPVAEGTFLLEVSVRELYVEPQRTAKATRTVVPSCELLPEIYRPLCRCECEADYVLGKCKDIPQPPPLEE